MSEMYREAPDAVTLPPTKKHCHACANILDVRAELCPRCGVRQVVMPGVIGGAMVVAAPMQMRTATRSKATAGIFALLLGGLGVHKFYLGQTGMGILYLLFFWTFIPALVSFVEGIIYLTMSDEAFAQKYG